MIHGQETFLALSISTFHGIWTSIGGYFCGYWLNYSDCKRFHFLFYDIIMPFESQLCNPYNIFQIIYLFSTI